MADVLALHRRDGTAEFTCTGCGIHVIRYGGITKEPTCATCLFLREHPDVPESVRKILRGGRPNG